MVCHLSLGLDNGISGTADDEPPISLFSVGTAFFHFRPPVSLRYLFWWTMLYQNLVAATGWPVVWMLERFYFKPFALAHPYITFYFTCWCVLYSPYFLNWLHVTFLLLFSLYLNPKRILKEPCRPCTLWPLGEFCLWDYQMVGGFLSTYMHCNVNKGT